MLNAYTGQEIFALVPVGSVTEEDALTIAYSVEEMNRQLEAFTEEELEDMRVLHGYITSAEVIPSEFNGLFPYIIIENPLDPGMGTVVESDADLPEELAQQIETILVDANDNDADAEYEIENVFIVYGYELTLQLDRFNDNKLQIEEYDVNDIQIQDAKAVSEAVDRIRRKHNLARRGPR